MLPNAKVNVINGETNAEYATVTTPTGNYTIPQLPAGPYSPGNKRFNVRLCDGLGLCVTLSHYPSGASKWNPIEHRLFSLSNWPQALKDRTQPTLDSTEMRPPNMDYTISPQM